LGASVGFQEIFLNWFHWFKWFDTELEHWFAGKRPVEGEVWAPKYGGDVDEIRAQYIGSNYGGAPEID
jgi:hypothetical protein